MKAAASATGLDHAHTESGIDRAAAALKAVAAGDSREAVALAASLPGLPDKKTSPHCGGPLPAPSLRQSLWDQALTWPAASNIRACAWFTAAPPMRHELECRIE